MCEVDVIANSLVLYLPFCSTLNKNFFSIKLSMYVGYHDANNGSNLGGDPVTQLHFKTFN